MTVESGEERTMNPNTTLIVEELETMVRVSEGSVRGCVDLPKRGARLEDGDLLIAGWALGMPVQAIAIEILRGDDIVRRLEIDADRPDIAAIFPDDPRAAASGFHSRIEASELEGGDVVVRVVLADGAFAPLAVLRFRAVPLLDPATLHPAPPGEYDLSTAEAFRRYQSSPAMRWAKLIDDDPPPGTAWRRITDNVFFEPLIGSEFEIEQDDRVFAIGSCFARGVEAALANLGVEVASRTHAFDDLPMRAIGWPIDFTNKYNTEAIRNELLWALEPGNPFPAGALQRLPDGRWLDPYATSNLEYADEETTLERHHRLTELVRQISDCRIVVITLGLIETFFDTRTGLYTNTTPHLTAEPDRFRFRVLSFEQVMEGLEDVHRLIARHGHSGAKIVVTVSPVPLGATFTGQDVVLANTLSKSVLRAAAGAWTVRHDNVHYFPSYEIVMNSDRASVWHKDGRHVRQPIVDQIMALFIRTHLTGDEAGTPELVASAS
jgi:hypothetical protein